MGLKIFGAFYEHPRNAMVRKVSMMRGTAHKAYFFNIEEKVLPLKARPFLSLGAFGKQAGEG